VSAYWYVNASMNCWIRAGVFSARNTRKFSGVRPKLSCLSRRIPLFESSLCFTDKKATLLESLENYTESSPNSRGPEVPLVPLLGLMHLRVALAAGVLRRLGRLDNRRVYNGARADADALRFILIVYSRMTPVADLRRDSLSADTFGPPQQSHACVLRLSAMDTRYQGNKTDMIQPREDAWLTT